jgi:sterol desaturase/sphingolipid hydroxylase (fatty acid hydroxylase superfamily)
MTMWSDNRNHLLDDMLRDSLLVILGAADRRGPGQFIFIVADHPAERKPAARQPAHALRRLGERLWISPRFHRLHHSIGMGHETSEGELLEYGRSPALGGHNFGVLLPWWDMMFGTANFEHRYDPTGIRDQVEPGPRGVRDYGRGFWAQQWLGLLRLVGRD